MNGRVNELHVGIAVSTPCISQCKLDLLGFCYGCRRSKAEIVAWRGMSEAERLAIMRDLSKRPFSERLLSEGPAASVEAG